MIEIKPLVDINGHETPVIFTTEDDLPRWTFDFYASYSFHRTPKQAVGILRRTWKIESIKDIARVHVVQTERGQWFARAESVRDFSFWSH
mgnify:FL=1